jgi:hypothetical protein
MGFKKTLAIAVILAGPLSQAASAAGPAPAGKTAADQDFAVDEYSVTAGSAPGSRQVAAGLTLGDSFRQGFCFFGGGRLSWVQATRAGETSSGWGLGAIGGIGYHPARKYSPVATLAVDKLFGLDDTYRYKVTASTGVRIRVVQRVDPHYAISLLVFRSRLYGSDGIGDRSDFGVAAAWSIAFLHRS